MQEFVYDGYKKRNSAMRFALVLATLLFAVPAFAVEMMTPGQVSAEVEAGRAVLIDIRTPEEWAETGVAQSARAIDMTSEVFVTDLKSVIAANPGKKFAFICRSGNRSGQLTAQLEASGLANIIDVAGGTSAWIAEGLPVSKQ
jgi:rhodanese-related sulfurtransferase